MPEFVPTNEPEAHKRRSTRIVQAVPLTVSGIDALGRPFQERTSTLIINCHGCRYQSKHYVLKNMWVTLEVPHPEPGHPPRTVRGRVMWIQRPRTVRELFQVGVELEASGNFWGIAFPPSDWFPFPEGLAAVPPPAPPAKPASTPVPPSWPAAPVTPPAEHNVRTLPLPATEPQPSLESSIVPEVARLVEETKQELQTTLRQSAAEAVSLEARPLIASLELHLRSVVEKSLEAAAGPAAERALQQAKQVQVDAFLLESNRSMAQGAERIAQELASRFEQLEKDRSAVFEQRLQQRIQETLERLQKQAAELPPPTPPEATTTGRPAESPFIPEAADFEERIRAQVERTHTTLSEAEAGFRHLQEQAAAAFGSAQSDWSARIEADLAAAANRWNQQVESSIESARQQLLDRLAHYAHSAGEQIEKDLSLRLGELGRSFGNTATDATNRVSALLTSLDQSSERARESLGTLQSFENQVSSRVGEQAAKLTGLAQAAEQALAERAGALVEAQSQEMTRRAESSINAWAERLQPALEASGQQTVTRLAARIKEELNAGVENASEVLARLTSAAGSAEEAWQRHQEIMAKAAEQAIQSAYERVKDLAGILSRELQESGRAFTDKWMSEIEAKATDTSHHTFESLYKTAEWYEKKIQTQMQTVIDKGMESAFAELKEKAREMSGVFGAELDHYSRSYVEHTHGQVEEAAREIVEKLRKQGEEMAAASAASIVQQAREDSEAALGQFRQRSGELSAQIQKQFESQAADARAKVEGAASQLSSEFRAGLKLQTQEELGAARKELLAQISSAHEELSGEAQEQKKKFTDYVAALNDQAIEEYRRKLEAASNSWLLTTASKLSQQSEQHLQSVTASAEERLRAACNEVFSGVGESLRRRLLEFGPQPAPPKSQD